MNYLSLCSGIEAATQAWHPLDWTAEAFSEIEPFPSAVLAHHYPETPNLGDMTQYEKWNIKPIDLLVGGTPCQSFSVAGLRKGLADPRGNLMLTYLAIAARFKPRWIVWENVPGVLSSNGGRDFGTFLGGLAQCGYGFAYRVLDAQYVRTCRHAGAVPQRRRRVFVVGHLGDWRRAAAVLFDRESLRGNPPPRREAGEGVAGNAGSGAQGGCTFLDRAAFNQGVNAQYDPEIKENAESSASLVARGPHAVMAAPAAETLQTTCNDYNRADGFNAIAIQDGRGLEKKQNGIGLNTEGSSYTIDAVGGQAVAFQHLMGAKAKGIGYAEEASPTLNSNEPSVARSMAVHGTQDPCISEDTAFALGRNSGQENALYRHMQVRRLTPEECEALQGFPRGFTRIPWRNKPADQCPDGPRYKALGNSMAVNCMEWIGQRINHVERIKL